MRKNHLIKEWAKLCESEEHPLENASSRELIPYVGEEIKKMKEDLEKCLRDVAYRFENSQSHPDMMKRYKEIRELIDGTKKELVDKIYRVARGESVDSRISEKKCVKESKSFAKKWQKLCEGKSCKHLEKMNEGWPDPEGQNAYEKIKDYFENVSGEEIAQLLFNYLSVDDLKEFYQNMIDDELIEDDVSPKKYTIYVIDAWADGDNWVENSKQAVMNNVEFEDISDDSEVFDILQGEGLVDDEETIKDFEFNDFGDDGLAIDETETGKPRFTIVPTE